MINKVNKIKPWLVLALIGFTSISNAGVAVVTSTNSPISNISNKDAKQLFLGKTIDIAGNKAVPVDQADGNPIKDTFYSKVANKNASQLKAYWSKKIFSGKGTPPESVSNDADVKTWISKNPSGIGYIDSSHVDSSIKVILEIP